MPTPSDSREELLRQLQDVSTGLLYPSETDAPFDAFVWKATEEDAAHQLHAEGKSIEPMTETTLDDFFEWLISGDEDERYRKMRRVLESQLTGIRVLRGGEIRVEVYLIGKTKWGDWAGFHTVSVET